MEPESGLFKGVNAQPPGCVTLYTRNGVQGRAVFYRPTHEVEIRARKEWITLISGVLQRAADRMTGTALNPILFLSGGLDSRLTGAALASIGKIPELITIADGENLEVKVAKQVAAALGGHHEIVFRNSCYYLQNLTRNVYQSGGRYRWRHSHFSGAYESLLARSSGSFAILGDFCEAFNKLLCEVPQAHLSRWTPDQFVASFDRFPLRSYRPYDRQHTFGFLRIEVARAAISEVEESIRKRYIELMDISSSRKILVDSFLRWQNVSTQPTYQMFLDVRAAGAERNLMFDNEVLAILRTLPASLRDSAGLGAELICQLHPGAGRVVDSNTLLPVAAPLYLKRVSKAVRPMLGKARRLFGPDNHKTTGSWTLLTKLYATDKHWKTAFDEILLDSTSFASDIFDHEAIRQAWRNFLAGDESHYQDLEKLLSIGIINRFKEGKAS